MASRTCARRHEIGFGELDALAEYDLDTAQHMLVTGCYLYVVFMSHLALEKMLKAHVTEATRSYPHQEP